MCSNAGFAEAERKFRKASAALNTVRGQREVRCQSCAVLLCCCAAVRCCAVLALATHSPSTGRRCLLADSWHAQATTRQLAEVRRRVQATKADKRYTLLQSHADRLGCALSEVGDTVEAEFAQLTKQYVRGRCPAAVSK